MTNPNQVIELIRNDPAARARAAALLIDHALSGTGEPPLWLAYKPLPKQRKVLEATKKLSVFCAANQVGKSTTGGFWMACRLRDFNPLDPKRRYPGPGRYWACTKGDLIDGLVDKVLQFIPVNEIERVYTANGRQKIVMKNGRWCKFKSYDQPRSAFQQEALNDAWCDEEMPREIWQELQTRLIKNRGRTLLTFSPIDGTAWLHELFFDERNADWIDFVSMGMHENTHLPKESVEEYVRTFQDDPDQLAIRVYGDYRLMDGAKVLDQGIVEEFWKRSRAPYRKVLFDPKGTPVESDAIATWWDYELKKRPNDVYVIGADAALRDSVNGDFCAGVVINATRSSVAATFRAKMDPYDWGERLAEAGTYWNNALINPEANSIGRAMMAALRNSGYPRLYRRMQVNGAIRQVMGSEGWETTPGTKTTLVSRFASYFKGRNLDVPCARMLDEYRRVVWFKKDRPGYFGSGASSGHDDLWMAGNLAYVAMDQVQITGSQGDWSEDSFVDQLERSAAEDGDDSVEDEGW